jgi:hypothetical protein
MSELLKTAFRISRIAIGLLRIVELSVMGQSTLGTLTGIVTDPSGAVLPNISVTVRNTQTDQRRIATTESDGTFQFVNLDAGTYEIAVIQPGFSNHKQTVELLARQTVRANVRLAVAGFHEHDIERLWTDHPNVSRRSGRPQDDSVLATVFVLV